MTESFETILPGRWNHLKKILERPGPFCHPDFEASSETLPFIMSSCKVLVIGAGGLGCELLKDLALMGFHQLHVIDMDLIDLSNLNRQFLFRRNDIGQPKAEVAAKFINSRIPGCSVTAHFKKIEDFDEAFYRQFHIVVCGLDNIVARRWINGMLVSLLSYDDNGDLDQSSVIPMVDGGTEGLRGNVRVILPGVSACVECTLDLYPPQVTYPLCTIANTPRLPEHCIEYAKLILWSKENPFDCPIDGDDPNHINWIYEKAQDRASQFNITGLSYRLVQGVVKNIIPAVASTNAVIAAECSIEVFKLATSCCVPLNNFIVFNDASSIYTYTYEAERKPNCIACSNKPRPVEVDDGSVKLSSLIEQLCEDPSFQMRSPGITANVDGKSRTLYMSTVKSIEERTRENLKKSLNELGLVSGSQLFVADATNPNTIVLVLKFKSHHEMQVD